ncbi:MULTISPECIES: molecular chaperone [unclassified Pseudomonas]|uniref:fimbrial biogenesis chaperone n=1 Tax=unclassified Pseudomonas TaxID=196821 RepID=UPI00244D045A|nr:MULTISPECIES: molecular chaperone [unclassified Pseudomonas]MDH0303430.1 molecular chaperone [Pseudomonas sp. GD04091]MDH1984503.1 molecular chaperone [Pseudomonas sp. GD03689]
MKLLSIVGWRALLLAGSLLAIGSVQASVTIATTRVVYPADQAEVTVSLTNQGKQPALVQAWIDDGVVMEDAQNPQVPFSLMPPLFRIDPGKSQSLRLFHTGTAMPLDRETLYWLNVLEVSPKGSGNVINVALRTRIKLFHRPENLAGRPADAHRELVWRWVRDGARWLLETQNNGPYVVNLGRVGVMREGTLLKGQPVHVLPFSQARFDIDGLTDAHAMPTQVDYSFIDDHGAERLASAVSLQ